MANNRRRRYLIDRSVQLGLLARLGLYAVYCLLTAGWSVVAKHGLINICWPALADAAPLLLALVALLPFVVFDLMKLTNRFSGPVYRMRVTLESLARGETIRPVKFRDGDFWCELAPKLNVLAARLGQLSEGGVVEDEDEKECLQMTR